MCVYGGWHRIGETAPFSADWEQIVCVCPLFLSVQQEDLGFGGKPGAAGDPVLPCPFPLRDWVELLFPSAWFVSMGLMRAPVFLPDLL